MVSVDWREAFMPCLLDAALYGGCFSQSTRGSLGPIAANFFWASRYPFRQIRAAREPPAQSNELKAESELPETI
jgi:hypothetical protein